MKANFPFAVLQVDGKNDNAASNMLWGAFVRRYRKQFSGAETDGMSLLNSQKLVFVLSDKPAILWLAKFMSLEDHKYKSCMCQRRWARFLCFNIPCDENVQHIWRALKWITRSFDL